MRQSVLEDVREGTFVGRIWRPDVAGPAVAVVRGSQLFDITCSDTPTMRDLLEMDDPAGFAGAAAGELLGTIDDIAATSIENAGNLGQMQFLAPCDLQAVKACGVTFANSMVERVIEEQAAGDASKAETIRKRVDAAIGDSLTHIVPGSPEAIRVKQALISEGMWSQYLEVGIGPDAEVFSKAQPLSSVGWGASVGLHPISSWNNPEPEIVLAVDSHGTVKGVALGNDVNLRDVEGRSALLLGKAKDNNASCAIGPFIRLFDKTYGIEDMRAAEIDLKVEGEDGFVLHGKSSMNQISRDPLDLVAQTRGRHHQYPDGFMLFLGTLFAPTKDRDTPGGGFTHKIGDVVTISNTDLGALTNTVRLSTECPEWSFGTSALMRNLAARNLI